MSPIVTLQRRAREVGRLRIGQQLTARNGRKRPSKLETFRFTSRDRRVIEAAADLYGGDVAAWSAPDGVEQWEVVTKAAELAVLVPPTEMAWSQWLETWSAAGCTKRCDGVRDVLRDVACDCDPDARECKITTRLSLLVPDLPGTGLWRFESHGYYAGTELAGVVELLQAAAARGSILPARLRLDQRSVKRLDDKGKPVTMRFVVPALDVDINLAALVAHQPAQDGLSALPSVPKWESISELPEAPFVSVSEQLDEVEQPRGERASKRAAAPIPSTNVPVGPRDDVSRCGSCDQPLGSEPVRKIGGQYVHVACLEEPEDDDDAAAQAPGGASSENIDAQDVDGTDAPSPGATADEDRRAITAEQRGLMHALSARIFPTDPNASPPLQRAQQHQQRIDLCADIGMTVTTTTDLTRAQMSKLIDVMVAIDDGLVEWDREEHTLTALPPHVVDVDTNGRT